METRKVLAALAYFSIFFLGLILPAVLYFVSDDRFVKDHAKAAFLSHCIPLALFVLSVVVAIGAGFSGMHMHGGSMGGFFAMMIVFGLTAAATLVVTVWNVYKGVKVLM